MTARLTDGDLRRVEVLLCDADGNLFPSEEPAFDASAEVTNRLMHELGIGRRFTATELRLATTGKNFRATAVELAAAHGVRLAGADLERWVEEERRRVTAHLRTALTPDPEVIDALTRLRGRFGLAAVSSSAAARLEACFGATGLTGFFPRRFSAEDSLSRPTSKPDPAIYRHALARLGVDAGRALAIEDAAPGVRSAVGAGITTIGHLAFVPPPERPGRRRALAAAGVAAVTTSWRELADLLLGGDDVIDTSDRDETMTAPAEPLPPPRRRSEDEVREVAERARTRDPTTPTAPAAG